VEREGEGNQVEVMAGSRVKRRRRSSSNSSSSSGKPLAIYRNSMLMVWVGGSNGDLLIYTCGMLATTSKESSGE